MKEKAQIVWKFNCNFDSFADGKSPKFGNITPLPNGHYLICMGSLNRLIETDSSKKIYWDCFTENSGDKKNWQPMPNYRANFTSSLYPCYFSVENTLPSDTLIIGRQPDLVLNFKIVNEGSNMDSYNITLKNDKNTDLKKFKINNVNGGVTKLGILKIKRGDIADAQSVTVTVISATNPKLSEQMVYVMGR